MKREKSPLEGLINLISNLSAIHNHILQVLDDFDQGGKIMFITIFGFRIKVHSNGYKQA